MRLNITIEVAELIYDIQNKTYLTGRSRSDGKNYRQVALMQANDDEENYNQIMRSIGNAMARVKNELGEVLEGNLSTIDNKLDLETKTIDMTLMMPSNFNQTAGEAISAAIHQYLVCTATAEWFMITNKPDTEDYARQAQEGLELLRQSLSKRTRPSRGNNKENDATGE